MNKEDEYPFWISRAVTSNPHDAEQYFYDKREDQLFKVKVLDKSSPIYRNEHISPDIDTVKTFSNVIERTKSDDTNILRLPTLQFEEKKMFLKQFVYSMEEGDLKKTLIDDIESFSITDDLGFKVNFRKSNFDTFLKFDMEKGKYLFNMATKLYGPLGVSIKSKILW